MMLLVFFLCFGVFCAFFLSFFFLPSFPLDFVHLLPQLHLPPLLSCQDPEPMREERYYILGVSVYCVCLFFLLLYLHFFRFLFFGVFSSFFLCFLKMNENELFFHLKNVFYFLVKLCWSFTLTVRFAC